MATVTILIIAIGFWICYQTSQRAELAAPMAWDVWIRSHKQQANWLGLTVLVIGLIMSMLVYGLGSGIFAFIISLSCVASLIILLAPLGYINRWTIGISFIITFLLEVTF